MHAVRPSKHYTCDEWALLTRAPDGINRRGPQLTSHLWSPIEPGLHPVGAIRQTWVALAGRIGPKLERS
ncbi:hypothetical protein NDU88_000998 [Pleurodeles waltl]|uniref:Uncharacterized protein n=1 Tax=Pleurodeles waltl TaxID=8319 RepID=A0AAV7U5M8_PLEWA|nr:hypothetical protein NDU88_000998 [Pleurodeles waltl]